MLKIVGTVENLIVMLDIDEKWFFIYIKHHNLIKLALRFYYYLIKFVLRFDEWPKLAFFLSRFFLEFEIIYMAYSENSKTK